MYVAVNAANPNFPSLGGKIKTCFFMADVVLADGRNAGVITPAYELNINRG
jgi:hypothetical protein